MDIKDKTCCFSGHRKINLPDHDVKTALQSYIVRAIDAGYVHFIAGGAIGFDTLAAEGIIVLKQEHLLTLEIAMPYPEQLGLRSGAMRQRRSGILQCADKITVVCRIIILLAFNSAMNTWSTILRLS